jgi:hypothetical protein
MTVAEAGRKGGEKVSKERGPEFYSEIGSKVALSALNNMKVQQKLKEKQVLKKQVTAADKESDGLLRQEKSTRKNKQPLTG